MASPSASALHGKGRRSAHDFQGLRTRPAETSRFPARRFAARTVAALWTDRASVRTTDRAIYRLPCRGNFNVAWLRLLSAHARRSVFARRLTTYDGKRMGRRERRVPDRRHEVGPDGDRKDPRPLKRQSGARETRAVTATERGISAGRVFRPGKHADGHRARSGEAPMSRAFPQDCRATKAAYPSARKRQAGQRPQPYPQE